jgi:hypothetical protein
MAAATGIPIPRPSASFLVELDPVLPVLDVDDAEATGVFCKAVGVVDGMTAVDAAIAAV